MDPYYRNHEVLEALTLQALNREFWLVKGESVARRPLKVETVEDLVVHIERLRGKGLVSVFSSVETFSDPLLLGLKSAKELRTGWDFVIDFDADRICDAQKAVLCVIDILESFNIKNFKVKFSGRRGFHLIIPGVAFNLPPDSFPDVPLLISRFLMASLRPDERRNVKFDEAVYKSRQMIRMAYSLHQKSGLISLPITDVKQFKVEDAKPSMMMGVDWSWMELKPRVGEAKTLFDASTEWGERMTTKPAVKVLDFGKGEATRYRWIGRLLKNPVDDGRHRLLWLVITPYLVNVKGLSIEDAKQVAIQYLMECDKLKSIDANLERLVDYYVEYAERKKLKPLSFQTLKHKYTDLYQVVKASLEF